MTCSVWDALLFILSSGSFLASIKYLDASIFGRGCSSRLVSLLGPLQSETRVPFLFSPDGVLFKVSSVWRWEWTASFPFSLHLTEHIRAVCIWAEFKISQRGCRVNMSAIGKAALPDWRNFCPANKQYSKLAARNLTSVQTSSGYCLNLSEKWAMEQVLLMPETSCSLAEQVATARVSLQPWWPSYQEQRKRNGLYHLNGSSMALFWQFHTHWWIYLFTFWRWGNTRGTLLGVLAVTLKLRCLQPAALFQQLMGGIF